MLTLLRDLRRLRREIALPRPDRGRSLALRHVDCGSCNGCEHELILTSSPYTDLERFGLGIVASPRHADVLLVTGPVTTRMHGRCSRRTQRCRSRGASSRWVTARSASVLLGSPDEIVGPVEAVLPVDCADPRLPAFPGHDRGGAPRADRHAPTALSGQAGAGSKRSFSTFGGTLVG